MSKTDIVITPEEISKFRALRILDETRLFYLKLRIEFLKRQKENPDKKKCLIIDELTHGFHQKGIGLGRDSILRIVYQTIPPKKSRIFTVNEL